MQPFFRKTIPAFLAGLLLCAVSYTGLQARNWDSVKAGSGALVLLDSTHVNVSDNGSGTFVIRKIVRILSSEGALANRVIKYDYDPLTAFAAFEYVRIIHPDGSQTDLNPALFCDYAAPARSIYWGARQIMAETGRLEPGDVIDYTIQKKGFTYALLTMEPGAFSPADDERFIPPMRGQFYDIIPFWVDLPTEKKIYNVTVPKEKSLQYEFFNGTCSSSVRFAGETATYSFAVTYAMPPVNEQGQVDHFDVSPKLMLSSTPEWKDKSLWFNKVNEDFGSFDPLPAAQKKVDELLKGLTDEMDKISVLTHWVGDNIRYSGISMGKGEGYTLHNTLMNFTDRCGVCKDKAGMLISMLRMAGFEAYPAMTMAGSRIETIPADHFNHCVVVVKLSNGSYIPLDPTWVPFTRELWSSAEQQQNYLPGIPEGSDLLITPVSDPDNHYLKISATTRLGADGTLTGEFTVSAEGQSDAAIRRPFTTGFRDLVTNALEAELLRVSPNARLIKADAGKNPSDYQKGPICMTIQFSIPGYAVAGENTLVCTPLVFSNLYRNNRVYNALNLTPETKQYGFKVRCSQRVVLDETLSLPKGFRLETPDRSEEMKGGQVISFSGYRITQGQTVRIHQDIKVGKRVFEADEWPEFRNAIMAHNDFAAQQLVLVKQ